VPAELEAQLPVAGADRRTGALSGSSDENVLGLDRDEVAPAQRRVENESASWPVNIT
jgi:hypothetical protein